MSQSTSGTTYHTAESRGPSAAVVEAVARAEGVDPTAIDQPLYEAVDPDALDDLLAVRQANGPNPLIRVHFTYYGYEVQVRGDGEVILDRK